MLSCSDQLFISRLLLKKINFKKTRLKWKIKEIIDWKICKKIYFRKDGLQSSAFLENTFQGEDHVKETLETCNMRNLLRLSKINKADFDTRWLLISMREIFLKNFEWKFFFFDFFFKGDNLMMPPYQACRVQNFYLEWVFWWISCERFYFPKHRFLLIFIKKERGVGLIRGDWECSQRFFMICLIDSLLNLFW